MIKDLKLELSNGIERGKTQGAYQKEIEIAKKMKSKNIPLQDISEITGAV